MSMVPGDTFNLSGYDEVARLSAAIGGGGPEVQIVVVHNNSTHYLVAEVPVGATGPAEMLASFYYGGAEDENGVRIIYAQALARAVAEALRR